MQGFRLLFKVSGQCQVGQGTTSCCNALPNTYFENQSDAERLLGWMPSEGEFWEMTAVQVLTVGEENHLLQTGVVVADGGEHRFTASGTAQVYLQGGSSQFFSVVEVPGGCTLPAHLNHVGTVINGRLHVITESPPLGRIRVTTATPEQVFCTNMRERLTLAHINGAYLARMVQMLVTGR